MLNHTEYFTRLQCEITTWLLCNEFFILAALLFSPNSASLSPSGPSAVTYGNIWRATWAWDQAWLPTPAHPLPRRWARSSLLHPPQRHSESHRGSWDVALGTRCVTWCPGDEVCHLVSVGYPNTPHAASARLLLRAAGMGAARCLKNDDESTQKPQENAQNPSGWKEPQWIFWSNLPA